MPPKAFAGAPTSPAQVGNSAAAPSLRAAVRLELWARENGFGRTLAWQAANPDPAHRRGLPFLPTFKVGGCRLVRLDTGDRWLRDLEQAAVDEASARPEA